MKEDYAEYIQGHLLEVVYLAYQEGEERILMLVELI
jgi:hypothetical protein